jgi:sialate O-acetylesterase
VFASCPGTPEALQPENAPSALYNGMLAPLFPFGLAGALFYQGESNVGTAESYAARMTAMIRDLRTRFGQGQFSFYYAELAGFRGGDGWPRLREAQARVLSEPVTGMSPTIDIGEAEDIHPRNKQEVGRRLAILALKGHYGRAELVAAGPTLLRVEIRGRICRVHFDCAAGLCTKDGEPVRGFEVAANDLLFKPATAHIEGACVVVESQEVPKPAALRYAFRDYLELNLVNEAGFPARPFRTDAG